jgi:hypothetical protein
MLGRGWLCSHDPASSSSVELLIISASAIQMARLLSIFQVAQQQQQLDSVNNEAVGGLFIHAQQGRLENL